MLVLSRRTGQTIVIDQDIKITVVRTKSGSVRLGIDAPRDVPVQRGELRPLVGQGYVAMDGDGRVECGERSGAV
jgi:carbon storage regulator